MKKWNYSCILFVCAMLLLSGCALIDPQKSGGIQQVGVWQKQAERLTANAPDTAENMYNDAQDEINTWIDTRLITETETMGGRLFGTVDLSEEAIPASVKKAITEYLVSVEDNVAYVHTAEEMAEEIFNEIIKFAQNHRKETADKLKGILERLKWKDWSEVHKAKGVSGVGSSATY